MSITEEQYNQLLKNQGGAQPTKKKSKYGNKPRYVDGYRFDSIKEANYYEMLKGGVECGALRYFLRQVPIHLAPKLTYRVDFLIVDRFGEVSYVDVKGYSTELFKAKKKLVEDKYPIKIVVVK